MTRTGPSASPAARRHTFAGLAALAIPLLAGCTTAPAPPNVERTQQMAGDYRSYELHELVQEADRIVEGEVVSTADVIGYPSFEGDDPFLNPLSEASEEEQEAARLDGAYATTEAIVEVSTVHKGTASDRLVVVQTGGVLDGVRYEIPSAPLLVPGEEYLLFLSEGDRPFLLGGGAGGYRASDDAFLARVQHAPVESLTRDELVVLVESDGARVPIAVWRAEQEG